MHNTFPLLQKTDFPALRRRMLRTLQVNLGYRCNQSCVHCHVAAGPHRTETMSPGVIDTVLAVLAKHRVGTLDLTGGAPELNPDFRRLVEQARTLGVHVIDRCNLTILEVAGQETLAEFLAGQGVEIVASLPCYSMENVDKQRGDGVFEASIRSLRRLNALGYGAPNSGLSLSLVYNPQGPVLPPPQEALEADYRRILGEQFGIRFTRLIAITNMPIQRFGSVLVSKGEFASYMALLKKSYQAVNLDGVMCRDLLSVDWQGYLHDCDFNQMLGLALVREGQRRVPLSLLLEESLEGNPIQVAEHCYGCTAGQGSSCSGALAAAS
ncbi:arsenosugar biosynthesis radical SAM (seleno)protein ArsS [Pandoraea sp.]|uniref:arsenosugar biosynthesis radical SAM (seleno)protein ArsS n=1 Tax=Pandoraea sp. TaxID=1883445 RepID=UPI001218FD18|nr:arsenosugar biosynthesis radical SAM (seleno)protein ArsS [Pandoraea sp.]TAL53145.1 MAG: radical SAM/Cys-rich domain protein [Pandoraea sp.]TAM20648.1 MAG: radical SAM/Cys-rich domain protein [Pandoraea sp.]